MPKLTSQQAMETLAELMICSCSEKHKEVLLPIQEYFDEREKRGSPQKREPTRTIHPSPRYDYSVSTGSWEKTKSNQHELISRHPRAFIK